MPRSHYELCSCAKLIRRAKLIANSGGRSLIFLLKNGIPGWKLFWTMKWAAIPRYNRKQRSEA